MTICVQNVARWDDPRVAQCGNPATVTVRETRSAKAAVILGKPFTDHEVCESCAAKLIQAPKFTRI